METYVAVTGPVPSIEAWEVDMRAIKFPFDSNGDGKNDSLIRCGVCPIRLYKIIHPEKSQGALMNHIGINKEGEYVTRNYPRLKKYLTMIQKLLKLQKCPLPTEPVPHMQPNQQTKAVAIVPIGTKKDVYFKGIEQI